MANPLRTMRMLLAFGAGAHSDRSKIEGHDLNQLQVAQLCGSHLLAVGPSHGLKAGQCTCGRGKSCKHPGRHPRTIQDATTDGELIHQSWTRWPKAKVIVATGQQGIIAVTARGRKGRPGTCLRWPTMRPVETLEFRDGAYTRTFYARQKMQSRTAESGSPRELLFTAAEVSSWCRETSPVPAATSNCLIGKLPPHRAGC